MPNHCYQSVTITGPRAVVHHLYYQLTEHKRFCDAVVPMPLEPWLVEDSFDEHGWYGWRVKNWGTKWDVVDVEVTEDYESHDDMGTFAFTCWTAWSPPLPVWERLHALGCELEADYEDEGMMFAGRWVNGDDQCWEPELPEEEEEDA